MSMACITLFLLVFTTTSKAASISSHSCNTPPLSASGDDVDMTDFSQVDTSLQYCMIDNCTIMRIDTREELDIVYTTESLLVAVPTDGYTSEIVLPLQKEVSCFPENDHVLLAVGFLTSFSITIGSMSAYIVVVHLLFPELQTVFGILLMSYNAVDVALETLALLSIITNYAVAVGSQLVCQALINMIMLLIMAMESYATCILFHTVYTMYLSSTLRSEMPKNLLLCYNCFVFGLFVIYAVIIIGYDLYSGNGKETILPDGYCLFANDRSYETLRIRDFHNIINKVVQLLLLVIFLFFYYKERSMISPASEGSSNVNPTRVSKQLFRIAVAMGAFVGIARIIWIAISIIAPNYALVTTTIGLLALLLQQCVVMVSFMCTQKMSRLWREHLCPQEDRQN